MIEIASKEPSAGLGNVSFHLACMANTDSLDYGVAGLMSTQQLLEGQQLNHFLAELAELSAIISDDQRLIEIWNTYADSELHLTALRRVMHEEQGQNSGWADKLLTDWEVFW